LQRQKRALQQPKLPLLLLRRLQMEHPQPLCRLQRRALQLQRRLRQHLPRRRRPQHLRLQLRKPKQ
jgi:hypothetical protein